MILLTSFFTLSSGIVKEEDLDRIDKIVQEESWIHGDEIDYNQKLVFSDEEGDLPLIKAKDTKREKESKERTPQPQRKDEDSRPSESILFFIVFYS